jgi:hypothetical protein
MYNDTFDVFEDVVAINVACPRTDSTSKSVVNLTALNAFGKGILRLAITQFSHSFQTSDTKSRQHTRLVISCKAQDLEGSLDDLGLSRLDVQRSPPLLVVVLYVTSGIFFTDEGPALTAAQCSCMRVELIA